MSLTRSQRAGALLSDLDQLIRQGQSKAVRAELRSLRLDRLAPAERVRAANLARRAGLPAMSVSILNPVVRAREQRAGGTPNERVEYAVALASLGAVAEAAELFDSV